MSGEMGHQLACQEVLGTGHCSSVSDARMSIPRSDRTNNKNRLSLGRIKKWLTDLEVNPNCSLGGLLQLALQGTPQATVEQLVHGDSVAASREVGVLGGVLGTVVF